MLENKEFMIEDDVVNCDKLNDVENFVILIENKDDSKIEKKDSKFVDLFVLEINSVDLK